MQSTCKQKSITIFHTPVLTVQLGGYAQEQKIKFVSVSYAMFHDTSLIWCIRNAVSRLEQTRLEYLVMNHEMKEDKVNNEAVSNVEMRYFNFDYSNPD